MITLRLTIARIALLYQRQFLPNLHFQARNKITITDNFYFPQKLSQINPKI